MEVEAILRKPGDPRPVCLVDEDHGFALVVNEFTKEESIHAAYWKAREERKLEQDDYGVISTMPYVQRLRPPAPGG